MSEMGQKPALSRRSIAVRFAPNKQTLTERVQCDAMCQNRTDAPQQTTHAVTRLILFDHLVSLDQDRRRNGQSKVPGDFEIYYELELLGLSDR